jgi:hypothetical protein
MLAVAAVRGHPQCGAFLSRSLAIVRSRPTPAGRDRSTALHPKDTISARSLRPSPHKGRTVGSGEGRPRSATGRVDRDEGRLNARRFDREAPAVSSHPDRDRAARFSRPVFDRLFQQSGTGYVHGRSGRRPPNAAATTPARIRPKPPPQRPSRPRPTRGRTSGRAARPPGAASAVRAFPGLTHTLRLQSYGFGGDPGRRHANPPTVLVAGVQAQPTMRPHLPRIGSLAIDDC